MSFSGTQRNTRKNNKKTVNRLIERMHSERIEEARALRKNEDGAPFPEEWPQCIKEVLEEFTPDVLTDELSEERRMKGPDMVIHLHGTIHDGAIPYKTTYAKDISIHDEAIGRQIIKYLCKQRIIRKIKAGKPPSDW